MVLGIVTGQVRSQVDKKATQFYNLNAVSRGFIVRNNTFDKQRRDAMRTRGYDGLIEGNTVCNLTETEANEMYMSIALMRLWVEKKPMAPAASTMVGTSTATISIKVVPR